MILQYQLQGVFVTHGNSYRLLLFSAFQGNTIKAGLFKFSMGKTEEFLSATWVVFMTHLL